MRGVLVGIVALTITYMISPLFRSIILTIIGMLLSLLSLTIVWFFVGLLLLELSK
jgi:hypothetical protein